MYLSILFLPSKECHNNPHFLKEKIIPFRNIYIRHSNGMTSSVFYKRLRLPALLYIHGQGYNNLAFSFYLVLHSTKEKDTRTPHTPVVPNIPPAVPHTACSLIYHYSRQNRPLQGSLWHRAKPYPHRRTKRHTLSK